MDTDAPDAPPPPGPDPLVPPFTVLEPGTAAPQTVPSTAGLPPSGPAALNPRSCVTCRRRKVRCDKRMPCTNCRRNHIQCIFPAPGRAPRRPRARDPLAHPSQPGVGGGGGRDSSNRRESELLERLRKLEGIVEELSGQIEGERGASASTGSPEGQGTGGGEENAPGYLGAHGMGGGGALLIGDENATGLSGAASSGPPPSYEANARLYKQFGRLVINKGRGRYISSAFWSRVKDELDDVRSGVNTLSDDTDYSSAEEDEPSPPEEPSLHDSFVFGYRSSNLDLSSFHPSPAHLLRLWQIYQNNVEPTLKIIHVPTIDKLFRALSSGSSVSPRDEALVFSIYYAAIVSLEDDECEEEFSSPKAPLLSRYRFALEQGMAKTNLLTELDLTVLTALVLFLVVVRRHDDTRFCWTTTGLAIRIAHGLGLHRDGTRFGLPPFEVEMRRRVWWSLCSLDMRCAEEAGTDLTIVNRTFDTEFPSNIDDDDITPEDKEMPVSREGLTDMAVALVRHETLALCRRLFALATAAGSVCPKDAASSMAERERMLVSVYERVENTFLRHLPSASSSISTMIAMVARIIMAKSSLVIYQPMLFPGTGPDLSDQIKERLFVSAVEIVEYVRSLSTDPRFKRWRWLFQTYTQWHAVAYILLEMGRRAWTPPLERAWQDLNGSLADGYLVQLKKSAEHMAVWMPMRKLLFKARKHRDAEIARLRADVEEVRRLEREDRFKDTGSRFGLEHVAGMEVDHAAVRRQWLSLVAPEGVSPQRSDGSSPAAASQARQVVPKAEPALGVEMLDEIMEAPFNPMLFFRGSIAGDAPDASIPTSGSSRAQTASTSDRMGPETTAGSPFVWPGWDKGTPAGMAAGLGATPLGAGVEEDGSMSLDEDFNWESWQESVRELAGLSVPPPMGNTWGL